MVRINVVLVLNDVQYRSAFIRAVSMEWSGFSFIVPDVRCNLKQFDAKLVIFDDDDNKDTLLHKIAHGKASEGIKSVYMTEEADQESVFDEPYVIYKYDSVKSIISKLRYIAGKSPLLDSSSSRCLSVSVISEEGGIGTTTFSIALAGLFNSMEKKSLYVSLAPVNICKNYGSIFEESADSRFVFSKFIYGCRIGRPLPVPSVVDSRNGINFIRCPTFNYHYSDFNEDVADMLIQQISAEEYKFLIYDIGNHITYNSMAIINKSDIVVCIHSIKHRDDSICIPYECLNIVNIVIADYDEVDRYKYEGLYLPRCREGNFYGFNNEYGLELSKIASVIGGLI